MISEQAQIEIQHIWDFLGGRGAYLELLRCFERVGLELTPEVDEYFSRFR